jgi:TonB-linked SusC/RagA family outer membrane protein
LDNVRLASTSGYNTNSFNTLNGATGIAGPTGSYTRESKSVMLSYFGRIQYSFNNKYLFSASIRRDGSSRFGDNTKWGLFPSASVGWRVSGEKFMEPVDFLSDLKLRASWGKSGNNNIGDYSSMPELAFYNYVFGGNSPASATGQAPSRVENPNLTWEKSETINAGVDIGVFQNRIFASFDYYTKNNTDLLLNVPIPQVTGYTTALTNIGQVKNKGWEVELNTKNLTGVFQWSTSVNFSHNENKVVKLGPGATSIQIPSAFDIPHSILKIGEPMYSINVVKQIGILSQSDIDNGAALFGKQTVGDPRYFDANEDGVIDANDRVIVGKPNPTYTWGFTNSFKYKGFDLTILVQGQNGGSIYSVFGRAIDRTGMGNVDNAIASHADRWRSEENPGNGLKGKAYSTFGRIKNTDWLYSSDYWRLRNITLGYNLSNLIPSKYLSASRIYLTAENYFGHDKYKGGYNPEATNTDLSGDANFPEPGDYGGLPLAKSLIIGLNLTF